MKALSLRAHQKGLELAYDLQTDVSGAKAISTLREGQGLGRAFPLILLDAQMEEMDGVALVESIKRNPEWETATIMMLSSAGQRGDGAPLP
jgi:CheY-like chemotaxis protein